MLRTKLKHYDHHPYLGVETAQDLDSGEHMKAKTTKAHRFLNLLRRNLSGCFRETKDNAYNTMIRPILEYAGAISVGPLPVEPYWHAGQCAAQGSSLCLQWPLQVHQCVNHDVDTWVEVPVGETLQQQAGHILPATSPSNRKNLQVIYPEIFRMRQMYRIPKRIPPKAAVRQH